MAQGKRHKPTEESRKIVKSLTAVGPTVQDIALKLHINVDTVRKYYKEELDVGRVDANFTIGSALYDNAKSGSVPAQIFWLKARAGWKEVDKHELSGANGQPIEYVINFGENDKPE